MSSVRNYLPPFNIIANGDMSQATLTSSVSNIKNIDNVCLYFSFTGTPTGVFTVYGNFTEDTINGVAMSFSESPVAGGVSGSILLNMSLLAFPFIYVTYTKTRGTGTCNVAISGKGW